MSEGERASALNGFIIEVETYSEEKAQRLDYQPLRAQEDITNDTDLKEDTVSRFPHEVAPAGSSTDTKQEVKSSERKRKRKSQANSSEPGSDYSAHTSSESYERDDIEDPFAAYSWLEAINAFARKDSSPSTTDPPARVGSCQAILVRREQVRANFQFLIQQSTQVLDDLAASLFDRFGRLRPEFKDQYYKKGTGIWGAELDSGDLLVIYKIQVAKHYWQRGIGKKLVQAIIEKTRRKSKDFFVMARDTAIFPQTGSLPKSEHTSRVKKEEAISSFIHLLGLRRVCSSEWFALSSDLSHPCHKLPSSQDYKPTKFSNIEMDTEIDGIYASLIDDETEEETLGMLQRYYQLHGRSGSHWRAGTGSNFTLLHGAAFNGRPRCTEWLLQHVEGLRDFLNYDGETPLELLLNWLEKERTRSPFTASVKNFADKFCGFETPFIQCIALLKGMTSPSELDLQRIKYGCTCRKCISGFLSPRMHLAILRQAERIYDDLREGHERLRNINTFMEEYGRHYKFLPSPVRNNLLTRKSMQHGFVNMFKYIAACLEEGLIPTEANVLAVVNRSRPSPPHTKSYLQNGGSVEAVASALFMATMNSDELAGDGTLMQRLKAEFVQLPRCRNDHEFAFVSGTCGHQRVCQLDYIDIYAQTLL